MYVRVVLFLLLTNLFLINSNESNETIDRGTELYRQVILDCVSGVKQVLAKSNDEINLLNKVLVNGKTLIFHAIFHKAHSVLVLLLKYNSELINTQDSLGLSPLHWAICFKDIVAAKLLLCYGASVNVHDMHGCTPLHRACYEKNEELVRLLLQSSADIGKKNNEGQTSLDIWPETVGFTPSRL